MKAIGQILRRKLPQSHLDRLPQRLGRASGRLTQERLEL
jgi:hypothetical protein